MASVVQLTTTRDVQASYEQACDLVSSAAQAGAKLVVLPENVHFMGSEAEKLELAEPIEGRYFKGLGELAKSLNIWLLAGTLPEASMTSKRAYNTSTLFSPEGTLFAKYRKIHLFDVALGEGATHTESDSVEPGTNAVVTQTELGKIGMTICYDIRFPPLFRAMFRAGAEIITVPAAFTVPTGRDHWEVLLRARAIENQCYILAAGQYGSNTSSRRTFGRSMIIDPWGTVLAVAPDEPGFALAHIDISKVHSFRQSLPCLEHERLDAYKVTDGR